MKQKTKSKLFLKMCKINNSHCIFIDIKNTRVNFNILEQIVNNDFSMNYFRTTTNITQVVNYPDN